MLQHTNTLPDMWLRTPAASEDDKPFEPVHEGVHVCEDPVAISTTTQIRVGRV
jgi:hypothetical protein